MKKCLLLDRHIEQGKKVEYCILCDKKIGKSFRQKIREQIDLIPQEKKQALLDALWSGKTVGEAQKIVDPKNEVDSLIWGQIISDNIGSVKFLRTKAK